jgi:hypothetical protein
MNAELIMIHGNPHPKLPAFPIPEHFIFFFFAVLGLELRAFTVSHYTSPIFVKGFLR